MRVSKYTSETYIVKLANIKKDRIVIFKNFNSGQQNQIQYIEGLGYVRRWGRDIQKNQKNVDRVHKNNQNIQKKEYSDNQNFKNASQPQIG